MSDRGQAFHLVEAAWGLQWLGILLINGGRMPGDCSVLCGEASSTQRPCSPSACPLTVQQPYVIESLIMKTWSKRRSIPLGLAEQPNREREQGCKKDWKEDEEKKKYKGRRELYSTLHSNGAIRKFTSLGKRKHWSGSLAISYKKYIDFQVSVHSKFCVFKTHK